MRSPRKSHISEPKAARAFYSDLPGEDARLDPLCSLQKEQFNVDDEEKHWKAESWHAFETS
jgi:hypothetical protein